MKNKVYNLANSIAGMLEPVEGIEAITLHESAESDVTDPYFFLSLDVYYRGALPTAEQRIDLFEGAGGFETSYYTSKDRFFYGDLPVRIEYKHIERVDHILNSPKDNIREFRHSGTYMLYRLQKGRALLEKSTWLASARERLSGLSEEFWGALRETYYMGLEHYLVDLKSAVARNDDLFYLLSLSGFIRSLCSLLCAVNRCFEPSGRRLFEYTLALEKLPENFRGRFYSILREDPEFPPARKQEIADLLTKSVVHFH
jgi:hypothetical protein